MAPVPRKKATYEDLMAVPDHLGWRRERMPRLPDVAAFTLCPDWVCEIVSPSTARADRVLKMPIYLREGVEHLWIVDPIHETLEIFRRGASAWSVASTHAGKDSVRAEPFGAVGLDLARWWIGSE